MTTLGPKAEAALKDGPKTNGESILDSTIVATYCETQQQFARRVALIAQEEERERLLHGAEALRDPKEATDEYSLGWDSAIRAIKEAAIREGR